ncbi:unnamed protein product, partial [Thelazia callipaeda]|uniref:DNA repair and recombination protein RAD54-like n=1 Tax=Thelazia callipaeda TaxID=103827 RepID=A0A0N5D2V2_THECL
VGSSDDDSYVYRSYEVLYAKVSSRVHKRWQGDGLLICKKNCVVLENEVSSIILFCMLFCNNCSNSQEAGIFSEIFSWDLPFILADEMGLGKTFQTISLIMALIKVRRNRESVIQNCLIVTPASLVSNWRAEFIKWFPYSYEMLLLLTKISDIEELKSRLKLPTVIITSYEMFTRLFTSMLDVTVDLLVCDEAHRLKNCDGRIREQLQLLRAHRRLLLTGTPMQNDLEEFYSLIDFVRPDVFSSFSHFKNFSETEPDRFNELLSEIMLRRTVAVIHDCLPIKNDYLVWCQPSPLQCSIYKSLTHFLSCDSLVLIDLLRKLCNHPSILYRSIQAKLDNEEIYVSGSILSGKLSVLTNLLATFREQNENVVIVSNFTQTLDLLEELCLSLFFFVFRLDGSIEGMKRMTIVDAFNSQKDRATVFLLSAKAGGQGLNLIGASRMILYDSDWNPAIDMQAMARIWRKGQKKPCHIFKLITAGTIDEKILQRQVKKSTLNTVIETISINSLTNFSDEELRDIFTLDIDTECVTHCLLGCQCDGSGILPEESQNFEVLATSGWNIWKSNIFYYFTKLDFISGFRNNVLSCLDVCSNKCFATGTKFQNASVAALMRWQHYSSKNDMLVKMMENEIGLDKSSADGITYVMRLTCNS